MSDVRVIIVHGTEGSPESNWFPWLASQLKEKQVEVISPQFPTPRGQSLDSWMQILREVVGELRPTDIVVGHSTGVVFLLHALEHASCSVRATFLVAGFTSFLGIEKYDRLNETFLQPPLHWMRIRENAGAIHLYAGSDDPYVPRACAVELEDMLGASVRYVDSGGHLNSDSGYTTFEMLFSDLMAFLS